MNRPYTGAPVPVGNPLEPAVATAELRLLHETLAPFLNVDHLIERVALAMAHSEGNRQAQERAHLNNYDALGYTALAKAAVAEVQRLGALAWPTAADATTGAAGKP